MILSYALVQGFIAATQLKERYALSRITSLHASVAATKTSPYIYGIDENQEIPKWLKARVTKVRAGQPQEWAPGKTPWPQAPKNPGE